MSCCDCNFEMLELVIFFKECLFVNKRKIKRFCMNNL